ncbi:hypothetical protein [Streptomyces syringium]|uniref:hypothetical protein n=1 Tax=Streptomyces syringium TaxID=76729 RepID=UPI0033E24624
MPVPVSVCRTTSPVVHALGAVEKEANGHRQALHGGHHSDDQIAGEVNRRGRWHADLAGIATVHARLSDTFAGLRDPGGMGARLWADAAAWLTITAG